MDKNNNEVYFPCDVSVDLAGAEDMEGEEDEEPRNKHRTEGERYDERTDLEGEEGDNEEEEECRARYAQKQQYRIRMVIMPCLLP